MKVLLLKTLMKFFSLNAPPRQTSMLYLRISRKETYKNQGYTFISILEDVSNHLMHLNGIYFQEKPLIIEESKSQPIKSLECNLLSKTNQNSQNVAHWKSVKLKTISPPKDRPSVPPKQHNFCSYLNVAKPRRKNIA